MRDLKRKKKTEKTQKSIGSFSCVVKSRKITAQLFIYLHLIHATITNKQTNRINIENELQRIRYAFYLMNVISIREVKKKNNQKKNNISFPSPTRTFCF